jgi:hypothetical protein
MTYRGHEISAFHEAGHTVYIEQFYPELTGSFPLPPEMLPPRTTQIKIWYDEEKEIHDGRTDYSVNGLSDEQLLFIALSGRVAEIMARTEGNWDIPAMQKSILSGEFDHTRDMEKAKDLLAKLIPDNQNNKREQLLAKAISQIFSFLKKHWSLVMVVAADLLSVYDKDTRKAMIMYSNLSSENSHFHAWWCPNGAWEIRLKPKLSLIS